MPLTNDHFVRANKNQHQVHKVTTSNVKYVETSISHLLVFKAICANMSHLPLHIMTFMRAKETDNAQSVIKFAAI